MENETIKSAAHRTPKALFQVDIVYKIPYYQRAYVWDKQNQWIPLWEDIKTQAERYLVAKKQNASSPATHFMGALVLQEIDAGDDDIRMRAVVDGQQRLITTQILLAAIEAVMREKNYETLAKRIQNLTQNKKEYIEEYIAKNADSEIAYKVAPSRADEKAYKIAMGSDTKGTALTRNHPLQKAYDLFRERTEKYLDGHNDKAHHKAHALEWAITRGLTFVVIRIAMDSDASEIFDSLNSRGTPLLTSDQAKNYLYWEIYKEEKREPTERRMKTIWPFDETDKRNRWWHQKLKIGRLGVPLEAFLRHWLTLHIRKEVKTRDVMAEFRKQVKTNGVNSVSHDLKEKSELYKEILAGKAEPNSFLFRWRRALQATTMLPILLKLRQFPNQERMTVERYLESYGVRRWICQLTNAGQTNAMVALLQKLDEANAEEASKVVKEFLAGQSERSRHWPDDQAVKNVLLREPVLRGKNTHMVQMILLAIEQHMQPPKSEKRSWSEADLQKLQIEHLYPQGWEKNWPKPSSPKLLDQIGNLTLASDELNPSMSNSPWDQKRKSLKGHSKLVLNEELWKHYEDWTEDTIRERSQKLAEMIVEIWPRPSAED